MSNYPIKKLVIHASATYPSMDVDINWIRDIHVNQNHWSDVGYHYFIRRDGIVEKGRPENIKGAHVGGGGNSNSLGICMAGGLKEGTNVPEDNFTDKQYTTLTGLLTRLHEQYPDAKLMGHNDFPNYASRGCPCFNQHVYFDWLKQAWKAMHKPADWYKHSKYDWHDHDADAWNIPETFMDEVDTGRPLD